MAGDEKPWYASDYVASPTVCKPSPREPLWTLIKAGKRVDATLLFHVESYGWECQCLYNGELAYGQRFAMRDGALEEAEVHRRRLLSEGWSVPPSSTPNTDG